MIVIFFQKVVFNSCPVLTKLTSYFFLPCHMINLGLQLEYFMELIIGYFIKNFAVSV